MKKSHTTPYHPMGDGLVECMNRSLLALLRTYVDREDDWEKHLQLLLFVTGPPNMPVQASLHMKFSLDALLRHYRSLDFQAWWCPTLVSIVLP